MSEMIQRGQGGKFLPGVSGNPGGYSKAKRDAAREVQELARAKGPGVIEALDRIVHDERAQTMARVQAGRVLLERGFGVPPLTQLEVVVEPIRFSFSCADNDDALDAEDAEVLALEPGAGDGFAGRCRDEPEPPPAA